jgi:lipoprotein-releasing system permease protein
VIADPNVATTGQMIAGLIGVALGLGLGSLVAYGLMYVLFLVLPVPAYVSFMSWRYMHRRRTNLIGVIGICVGVGALIMILSIMTGFLDETRATVRGTLSDVVVTPLFAKRPDGKEVSTSPETLLGALRGDPRVQGASAHLVYACIISKGGAEAGESLHLLTSSQSGDLSFVQLVGIDVEDEFATTELRASLEREPRYGERVAAFEPGAAAAGADVMNPFALPPGSERSPRDRGVIVGDQLFAAQRLSRGERIHVLTVVPDPKTGEMRECNREYVVCGTFRSGENELDLQRIYIERAELADLIGHQLEFSEVLVDLKDYERDSPTIRDSLALDLAQKGLLYGRLDFDGRPTEVKTWQEFRGPLLGAIENERVLMGIMLSLVMLVAGFTIFAILSMMVTEKRRDIGILTALGATPNGVLGTFVAIGLWDALIGAWCGAALGTYLALKIDPIERWLSHTFGIQIFNRNVYLFDSIPSVVEPASVALIVLGAFVCALLFAAIPAWKAARLDPLDALRYE